MSEVVSASRLIRAGEGDDEFTHFTRKPKKFDMTASIQIESSVIKPKRSLHMGSNLHKSEASVLSSGEIRYCIRSISLTSTRQRRGTVRQGTQTRNTTISGPTPCCRSVQKSKHRNAEGRNVHKPATCSPKHATE